MAIRPGLRDELMKLSAEERLELAEQLYESVPELDFEIAESWAIEIRRRIDGIRQGTVVGVPADQAFAQARAGLVARDT